MSQAKFEPVVYHALKDKGLSNRRIGTLLGVNEASVRRGLKDYAPTAPATRRGYLYVFEDVPAAL